MSETTRDGKLRYQLSKRGLLLRKSRARNINLDDFGEYMIIDAYTGCVIAGSRFDLTLDEVELWNES